MDYQGNTNKDREKREKPEKKIEKVVTGEVVQKPKSIGRKFKDIFLGGDFKRATRVVTADVLLPALRSMIFEVGKESLRNIIFGESIAYRNRPVDYHSRTQYNNPLSRRFADPREHSIPVRSREVPNRYKVNRREFNDIILSSREEAETVVERLIDIIEKYEVASLADLYELLGLPSSHIDNKWGWTYLNNVEVRQIREGYLIDLPAAEEI